MIVKNEAHVIVKTLNNLCEKIDFSYWVICDTGSTDNTKDVICDFFKEKNIKGELYEHEWKDFGYNRTLALESAYNKTDLLFIFDADDEIVGDLVLPHKYEHDGYTFNFGNDVVYIRPLLINNRKRWHFVGVLHEYLACSENSTPHKNIEGNYYIVSGRTGNRSQNPNKYFDDANILKKAHYDVLESDYGLSCRYAFYCAQSYKDSGYMDEAIEWYKKCLELNMWLQEKYVSAFAIGNMYMAKNDMKNALKYWYKTIEYDPERIEGVINAINYLTKEGEHLIVNALYHKFKNYNKNLSQKLFMVDLCYKDQLEYNNAISAFYINDKESGYECCKKIFTNQLANDSLMKATISNFLFYIDLFDKEDDNEKLRLFYQVDGIICNLGRKNETIDHNMITCWNKLFDVCRPLLTAPSSPSMDHLLKNGKNSRTSKKISDSIMITFTTCKRLDLFKQTVYSILNHWLDVKSIGTWFCVDDNSNEEDRCRMRSLFPWIQYHMKPVSEKGHRNSMNIIWNKLKEIKPKYWIHMEDDFLFHRKMNYIEDSINALKSAECVSQNVKQVLFNKNYGEIIDHYNSRGHVSITDGGSSNVNENIVMHKHCDGIFNYMNCHYWPHYSFRPSIIDASVILELGNYDSKNQFFEMDYAKKWAEKGYKSAFFNKITCRHIGRLTSDRNTKIVKNAYDLNNEEQFVSKSKEESDLTEMTYEIETTENNNAFIKIINLERRSDRKKDTMKKLVHAGVSSDDYEFIKAVDGSLLEPTSKLKHLFRNNDFGSRRGVIGCALSHYNLWKRLVNDSQHEYYVIMEDDFILCSNFKKQLETLKINNEFATREVLFLGYHMFEKNRNYDVYNLVSDEVAVTELNKDIYIGGYFAYSINKNGAKKLLEYIDQNGINHGIDYLNKILDNDILESHECQPQIVFSDWNENGKKIDSDIQNAFDSIDFSEVRDVSVENIQHIKADFVFIPGLDVIGSDLYNNRNSSLEEKFLTAIGDSECVGFNTLGFFKDDVTKLQPSGYFKEGDGIYIKKHVYDEYLESQKQGSEIIRIKMLCNWTDSKQLCKEWSNMCESELRMRWKNYRMVWTDRLEDIDYYVIVNRPPPGAYYDPKKTIVFQMEPWVHDENKPWGVKTWGEWAEPDENKFMHVHSHKKYLNNVQWLNTIPEKSVLGVGVDAQLKNRVMSILSEKNFDDGHIKRIEFIRYMESSMNCDFIDVYGRQNYHNFLCYKGTIGNEDKYKNYKYCISVENNSEYNYATEKIWEPILCECLCFYWGCPNIGDYIDDRAYVLLDMNDFEKSCEMIKRAIEEDWWSERIDIIRKEKEKILNELAFFPTLDRIVQSNGTFYSQDSQDMYLEKTIFKGYKNGFFVDVGAHDGVSINNTLHFEKYNNWKGINVEPIKKVYDKLVNNRPNSINLNLAVCNNDGETEFLCNTGYTEMISGIKDNFDSRHWQRLQNENKIMGSTTEIIKVNTKKLETICHENNISHINYLSIDVEGAEFEVIKSINFDKVFIDVIGFENNYDDNSVPIIKYLEDKNYVMIHKSLDIFMIHRQSIFYK
jgi:FkbM family methyltransferase